MTNHPNRKLTPALRKMLEFIAGKPRMLLQISANGPSEREKLNRLREAGWVEYCDIQLSRSVADGVRATDAGRAVLNEGHET